MKKIIVAVLIIFPTVAFSQVLVKAGGALGNRWTETLNSQTLGKGLRLSGEKFLVQHFSIGAGISYFSFNPNKLINVSFNSYSLQCTYYFNTKKLHPYLGAGVGYTWYKDETTIDLGNSNTDMQTRDKDYGVISPYVGLQYGIYKKRQTGFFIQVNTDFVPIANIQPIGFISIAAGVSYHLPGH
ncbi:MAG: hypothetical protein LH478_06240 [Chitinophagaceae bacterium]|nr:hypothetical protein [Chitinophagaceae bacterium]